MKWIEVSERELPVLVTRFSCFTGIDLSQLEPDHQLYLWNKEYEMARSETLEERAKRDYTPIVEFAQFLKGISLIDYRLNHKNRPDFIRRLRDKNKCYGVFFEITVLIHFKTMQYEPITYLDNWVDGKNPDISITVKPSRKVYVECTRKDQKPKRCNDHIKLMQDLIRALRKKAHKYRSLDYPLIIAVHVPEKIEFDQEELRIGLKTRLHEMFKESIFRNVNYVWFSSYRLPERESVYPLSREVFVTDLKPLLYKNGHVEPHLQAEVNWPKW